MCICIHAHVLVHGHVLCTRGSTHAYSVRVMQFTTVISMCVYVNHYVCNLIRLIPRLRQVGMSWACGWMSTRSSACQKHCMQVPVPCPKSVSYNQHMGSADRCSTIWWRPCKWIFLPWWADHHLNQQKVLWTCTDIDWVWITYILYLCWPCMRKNYLP